MAPENRSTHDPVVLKRMQMTTELFEAAQLLMRQNLRRRHPDLDEVEIERKLQEWRLCRPGAEHGDGVGLPVPKEEIDAWLASRRS